MDPEEIDDPTKHRFTNLLEAADPRAAEKEPAQLLWDALNSDRAKQHFDRIARITGSEWREAGFVIYRSSDAGYELSNLVESVDSPERQAIMTVEEALLMHGSLNLTSLTHQGFEQEPMQLRNDLLFLLHSHPAGHDEARVDDWLRPSAADLESWEKAAVANPGLTEAIVVVEGDQIKMLLYRHKPERTLIPYYQQLDGGEAKNRVLRVLRESNIDVTTLTYSLSAKRFTEESQQALQKFLS